MQLSVSMCVIGSLICNQNDKLHVILTILFLQRAFLLMIGRHRYLFSGKDLQDYS